MSFGPNYFVYLGQTVRDDVRIRALSSILGLSTYDAKILLGAPGPRKVFACAKPEEADVMILALREAGLQAFVIDKERFSRVPALLQAVKAVEDPSGLTFSIDRLPDLPLPKGIVKAVVLGFYTTTSIHASVDRRSSSAGTNEIRNPFVHLYYDDPHTIVDIRGPRFAFSWLDEMPGLMGDVRWNKLAERLAAYYNAKLDTTLFRNPAEARSITAALNVDVVSGRSGAGGAIGATSSDDTPVVLAASRIIVYTLVYGL